MPRRETSQTMPTSAPCPMARSATAERQLHLPRGDNDIAPLKRAEDGDSAWWLSERTQPTRDAPADLLSTPNRARLQAALAQGTPAAVRFRTKVDQWLGGASPGASKSWNGALLSQLTGNTAYCTKSVAEVQAQVAAAETASRGGPAAGGRVRQLPAVGEMVGDLALVYDWCYAQVTSTQRARWIAYANQAV